MINIYSIKEVIEASNNILNRTNSKIKVTSDKSYNKNDILMKKNKPLILTDEVSNENQPKTSKIKSDFPDWRISRDLDFIFEDVYSTLKKQNK